MASPEEPSRIVPQHIAIIMDGNGRWAKERGLPRLEGHRAGVSAVRRAVDSCLELGVRYLTLYSFSSENWQRSSSEVSGLMSLFYEALTEHHQDLIGRKVQLRAIGDVAKLPKNVRDALSQDIELTEKLSDLTLTLAVSYGGREELVHAAQQLASKAASGELKVDDIDESSFSQSLWTKGLPDPDLMIRSSGEMRISNFLLWQLAYAEIIVIPEFWPEFDMSIMQRCVDEFSRRERRFGRTSEQLTTMNNTPQSSCSNV